MDNSEAKRILHEWILDYMFQNKMNHTAVMFAQEANVRLDVPMTGEGLLEKWWNIFFRHIYLSRLQTNPEAMEVSSSNISSNILHQNISATDQNSGNRSKNIRQESPRQMNHMLQNTNPTMGMPGIQNSFPNACQEHLLTMGMPGIQDSFPNACQATQNRGNLILHQNATDQNSGNRSNIRQESPRPMNHMLQNTNPTMGMPGIQNSFPNACQEHLLTMGMPGIQDSFPNACQATQNLPEDVLQELSWRDMSYLLQNPTRAVIWGMPGLHNHSQTVHSTAITRPTMVDFRQKSLPMRTPPSQNMLQSAHPMMTTPSPNMANLPQSAVPTTAQGQELDSNHLGSRSSLESNAGNLTAESRQGLEHPRSRDRRDKTTVLTTK